MRRLVFFVLFFVLSLSISFIIPVDTYAAIYSIPTSIKIVNGGSYCGGKACKGGDKLIIKGGSRRGLLLKNFNGQGTYITVTNENTTPDKPVIMDQGPAGYAILSISNCKWLNIRGDNDPDLNYGIRVNNGAVGRSAAIHVYGKSEHIKIGYTEILFDGNTGTTGIGIRVQDAALSSSWIFDTFEIHHNNIIGAKYAGMCLGHNDPDKKNDPYTKNFSIHDNIIKNSGGYGLNLKAPSGGVSKIYNNIIDTTGLLKSKTTYTDHWRSGILPNIMYDGAITNVYNNTVMNTVGACIDSTFNGTSSRKSKGIVNVYNNKLLNCGTGKDERFGHGIVTHFGARMRVYDNVIVKPNGYGIWVRGTTTFFSSDNNLVADSGAGAALGTNSLDASLVQEINPNVYHANVENVGFTKWSNDGNYYNDIFTFDENVGDQQILIPKDLKIESQQ